MKTTIYIQNRTLVMLLLLFVSMFCINTSGQNISGKITDENGEPLPFANITIKGTTIGAVSDFDGNYNIKASEGNTIIISCLNYKNKEITIGTQSSYDVQMETDNMLLDEIVAVGYGTMKKSDLTGAVSSIKAEQLKKTPAAGLDQALQGRAAGVTVNANSGQPGAAAEVRIRGIGSVVGNSSPIYVVDGVITDNISFLSPTDIASTEVLKDASATAIYGSRGANGVILVNTKNGTNGTGTINVDCFWGIQNRWHKLDLMKRDEMARTKVRIDAMKNGAKQLSDFESGDFNEWMYTYNIRKSAYAPRPLSDQYPDGFDYSNVDTDWQDEVFNRNAVIQSYSISTDGANDKGHYAVSFNYFNQEGTIIGSDFSRFTIRINSDYKIKDWLRVGEHISFASSKGRNAMNNSNSPGASVISAALAMAPWDPVRYPDGTISSDGKHDLSNAIAASTNFKNVVNPISMVQHSHPSSKDERIVGDINVEINPIKGLIWKTLVSIDINYNRTRNFKEKYLHSDYDKAEKNYISSSINRAMTFGEETTLSYLKDWGKNSFNIMVGQTLEEYNYYNIGGSGASVINDYDSNNWYLNKSTEDRTEAGDAVSRNRRLSFLGRLHYAYDSKYLITINFRADGSSKFPNNTWGYFPSTALAWRISQEEWMHGNNVFDNLKLRLGWGRVGNDKIGDDAFTQTVFTSGPTFVSYPTGLGNTAENIQPGAAVLTLVNQNGKWETNEQWNAGIDFGVLGGHLNGSFDWFLRKTKDALLYVDAPAHVGNRYSSLVNVGTLQNAGFELQIDYANSIGAVHYNIGANASVIKNKLKELNGGQPLWGDRTVSNEGLALNTFWGYQYQGIYQTDAEALAHQTAFTAETIAVHAGDARFADRDMNGKIDETDRTDLGNPFPKFTYGLNLGAEWNGFDLQIFFQGVQGNKIYNALRERTEGAGDQCTLSTTMRNAWIGYSDAIKKNMVSKYNVDPELYENRAGTIPNPLGASSNKYNNDRLIEDGSYLRLKNIQLGYTVPKALTQKWFIQKLRIYAAATNLFTITNYTGYDPEVGGGVDYGNYPQSRTITFGLNMNL